MSLALIFFGTPVDSRLRQKDITTTNGTLAVWDVQTGILIREFDVGSFGKVAFSGDQTIVIDGQDTGLRSFSVLSGMRLGEDCIGLPRGEALGAHWICNGSLRLATKFETSERLGINIRELHPTSDPLYPVIRTFPVPPCDGEFCFSPPSFHAAFFTTRRVNILNVQSSQILLHTGVALRITLGCFSPSGSFFACGTADCQIYVWKNGSTSYEPWATLQSRSPFFGFSFSPTKASILTWGQKGIQLLYLGSSGSTLPPNKNSLLQNQIHSVAFSPNGKHIAVAQQGDGVITLIDSLSTAPLQSIKVDDHILDLRIIGNVVHAASGSSIFRWNLEPGETMHSAYSGGEVVTETLGIDLYPGSVKQLILSDDCSQIAYVIREKKKAFLFDVESKRLRKCDTPTKPIGVQFSPDGHQLWTLMDRELSTSDFLHFGVVGDQLVDVTRQGLLQVTHQHSPHGYSIGEEFKWVEGPGGRKLLWLPPSWREANGPGVRWEGSFLVLVNGYHPKPIIIDFQS